jgi:hypothetical protein
MQATIESYLSQTAETPDQVSVTDYGLMLETLLPIQTTIKGLVELDHLEKRDDVGLFPMTKQGPGVSGHTRGAKGFAKGK